MEEQLYEKWLLINKNLRNKLKIETRKEKKILWNTIKETVTFDFNPYNVFLEYKLRPYELEIKEIYKEKMAIEILRPFLLSYIHWKLYNPVNGIRFLKALELWNKRF